MKKIVLLLTLCASLTLLAACGKDAEPSHDAVSDGAVSSAAEEQPPVMGGNVQIANPFYDFDTQQEAEESVGIVWGTLPEVIGDYDAGILYRSMPERPLLEVIYQREDGLSCRIRKAPGSEDISGNYSADTYEENETCMIGDAEVTLQGNEGLVFLATWVRGDYSYSLDADGGLSREEAGAVITALCG